MYILGISCFYHDAAAALLKDGKIIAAAEEERFTRKKHDYDFPRLAIRYCLKEAGIDSSDLDYIGFYEKPFIKFERILTTSLSTWPNSFPAFIKAIPLWMNQKLWIRKLIEDELEFKGKILFIEHHLSHAASCFLVSPYSEAAVLTLDGVGEWTTTTRGFATDLDITLTHEQRFPHSLGLLYSAFTAHLGFEVNEGEYKVMGLAPYGKLVYTDKIWDMIQIHNDGSFQLDMSYFAFHYGIKNLSRKFNQNFGPSRKPESPMTEDYANQAASIQNVLEEIILRMSNHIYQETKIKNLVMAGGVALNCVANGRVLRETPFENIWIQPGAGDSGGSIGVASYIYHTLLRHPRNFKMNHVYLGPQFDNAEIKNYLDSEKITYKEFAIPDLVKQSAQYIANGKVLGWFQGRMEFGPRALGSRSILADARDPKMKDILNEKIKHREQFRPFAPVILREFLSDYFDMDCDTPFMLLVADVKPEKRTVIPSITHVDGTARIQSITRQQNEKYYDLIHEFYKITGVPVLINTSFNVRGEPIVCTPQEAYQCFSKTDMDYLVMGNFIISKSGH